jgi:glycosyltransferase involved in cell wall biosynthesis
MNVTCIVPAHNEGSRIRGVLDILTTHELVDEVIVVDDASTDHTHSVSSSYSTVRVVRHTKNAGKTAAILTGLSHAQYDVIMLIDADLIGLTHLDITNLLAPVLSRSKDISISLRGNALGIYKLLGVDFVSGERVMRRDFFESVQEELQNVHGFGLEVTMNKHILHKKMPVRIVHWPHVYSPRKHVKMGLIQGARAEMRMLSHIFKTISPYACMLQMVQLRALSRNK